MQIGSSDHAIDLNADLGEGFPWDEALLDRVSSASISCGAHAGSDESIRATLGAAKARKVVVGAHPGYADREHFGRVEQNLSALEIRSLIEDQLARLTSLADETGLALRFVKPHGALYNQAQRQPEVAAAILESLRPTGLPILGQPGGCVQEIAALLGHPFIAEGFADRRYGPDGFLLARSLPGAVLHDPSEIESQLLRLVSERKIQTICIHGDNPDSLRLADLVLNALETAGIPVRSFV